MPQPHDPLASALHAHASQVITVADLAALRAARVQWERPRAGLSDVSDLNIDDPTGATVVDPDRLRLRAAYLGTVATFERATAALVTAEAHLRAALAAYGEAEDEFPERPADLVGTATVAA